MVPLSPKTIPQFPSKKYEICYCFGTLSYVIKLNFSIFLESPLFFTHKNLKNVMSFLHKMEFSLAEAMFRV